MEEFEISSEKKTFDIELSTDKNNSYKLNFISSHSLEITANQINSLIHKSFSGKYTFEEIQENKYFLQFDTLNEILDEIKERILNNKIIIKENENNLILNIPLSSSKNKEIIFELKPINKNSNEAIKELNELVIKQNKEILDLKNEVFNLKKIANESNKLKDEVNNLKNNESQF